MRQSGNLPSKQKVKQGLYPRKVFNILSNLYNGYITCSGMVNKLVSFQGVAEASRAFSRNLHHHVSETTRSILQAHLKECKQQRKIGVDEIRASTKKAW